MGLHKRLVLQLLLSLLRLLLAVMVLMMTQSSRQQIRTGAGPWQRGLPWS